MTHHIVWVFHYWAASVECDSQAHKQSDSKPIEDIQDTKPDITRPDKKAVSLSVNVIHICNIVQA